MTVEHAVHRLTAEVADWFGLDAGTLREGDRADFVVIDPAGLDDSVDGYHEEKVPFYGGLSRMVNRNDAAVVATGVGGTVVFRNGEFCDGYGTTVKSGRFLRAGHQAGTRRRLRWPERNSSVARRPSRACSMPASPRSWRSGMPGRRPPRSPSAPGCRWVRCSGTSTRWAISWPPRRTKCCAVSSTWSPKKVAEIPADRPALDALLTILRDVTRNPTNAVMYELMIAARTDEKLRATLQEVLTEYDAKIYDAVAALPGAENVPEKTLAALVATLINTFDGAAIVRAVVPQPKSTRNSSRCWPRC